ncbi:MAG: coproporphyrinogen III oxidase [Rhodospirillaceae bacterium]|nr:coproporphyrinogen III oxidase [Rhodospirillaceae bacterium]
MTKVLPPNYQNNNGYTGSYPDFGLYVHWPYCQSKCPYCDFNSHVAETIDHERFALAYERELSVLSERLPGRRLATIFFGGGTPSLMQPETVHRVISTARRLWPQRNDIEITMEANPGSVEAGRLAEFRGAGVDRISLGVQSFDEAALSFLGRRHSVDEARKAIEIAQNTFERVSFDLIYARPDQTAAEWRQELSQALEIAGEHLSVYQLTIEPGTAFEPRHARGEFSIPGDDLGGSLYEMTQELLEAAGRPAYEVSNHARPGTECRHNLIYWRQGEYLGIGPGAHGRLNTIESGQRRAIRAHRAPAIWLDRVETSGHGLVEDEVLDRDMVLSEVLMMGLRLAEGVPRDRLVGVTGQDLEQIAGDERIKQLVDAGYFWTNDTDFGATASGRQRLDGILSHLLANS